MDTGKEKIGLKPVRRCCQAGQQNSRWTGTDSNCLFLFRNAAVIFLIKTM